MRWPAHGLTIRLAAKNANKIRQAFKSTLHGDEIARQWAETHPAGGSVSPQMARDWANVQIVTNKKPMQNALSRIYAEGYVTGEYAANYMLAHLLGLRKAKKKNPVPVSAGVVDWATWKPGSRAAAALVRPKGGLENLLATRKITISNEVMHTKLDRIGTALANALDKGWSVTETAKAIDTVIDDPQQALAIAQTEMSRAVSIATRDRYESAGVEKVEWLVAEGCDDCQENADASPIGIDETFPSGDSEPPAHPNCMCALAAYFDDSSTSTDEEL
jgi:Phage Mu protein F like protein